MTAIACSNPDCDRTLPRRRPSRLRRAERPTCSPECRAALARLRAAERPRVASEIVRDGYVYVRQLGHPHANGQGYVLKRIVVAEAILGRALRLDERVTGPRGDRADCTPEHLMVEGPSGLVTWLGNVLRAKAG